MQTRRVNESVFKIKTKKSTIKTTKTAKEKYEEVLFSNKTQVMS